MISTADVIMCLDSKQQEIAEPNPVSSIDYKFPAEEEMLTSPGDLMAQGWKPVQSRPPSDLCYLISTTHPVSGAVGVQEGCCQSLLLAHG